MSRPGPEPATPTPLAADGQDRLRFGVLGAARIARTRFVPGVQASTSTRVVALASRDPARARAAAADLAIPRAHASYDDLLADPDVEAVYLALPNALHPEWTIRAAAAGKHVLCEKPLARRAADAARMRAACRDAGVLLMEAFMWRHHPQHATVRALLDRGDVGEPRVVRASFAYTIAPQSPEGDGTNVRLQPDLDGGSLMDVGCYPVNAARWLFGAEPIEASGLQVRDPAHGVETTFAGLLRFPGDRLALVDSSFAQASHDTYTIVGTEGTLTVEHAFRPDARPGRVVVVRGDTRHVEEVPPADQFAAEADHFAASVRAGRLLPPAEDGLAQARVVEALYASAESGRAVRLD